jgi:hypothetical protein
MLAAVGIGTLATGRWRLEMVRDATDAKVGRWLIGVFALAAGVVVSMTQPVPAVRLPAIALGAAGLWTIATAARYAPTDQTVGMVERAITASAVARAQKAGNTRRGSTSISRGRWWCSEWPSSSAWAR